MDKLFENFFDESLDELKRKNIYRDQSAINQKLDNQTSIVFSDNDYLGLAQLNHSSIDDLAGLRLFGSTGSRLTTGSQKEHQELEQAISNWKNTEAIVISAHSCI